MNKQLVSIVTPCYNGEMYLKHFLDSIAEQTYRSLELVLVNDGSTDRTEDVVNEFRPKLEARGIVFIYQYQSNAGQAAALNRGLKLFSGEYLLWLDSDDELSKNYVEEGVCYLQQHPEIMYCYGKAVCVLEENPSEIISTIGKRKKSGRYDFFKDISFNVKDVFFPGYICRTSALDKVIRNRDIYSGKGGQNAQLLLPLAWYYGEPGFVEKIYYKYYIRKKSHSHSQNTSIKVIHQLERYEMILCSTLRRIEDQDAWEYIPDIERYYARLRFENSVDTKDGDLIRKYFSELKLLGIIKKHDILMKLKYSNPVIRKLLGVR